MTESELYKELGILTKQKERWEDSIPYVLSLLSSESVRIKAKALWLLGEMGFRFPSAIQNSIPAIASFLGSGEPLLRERAVNALGRIGRSDFSSVAPYREDLLRCAADENARVRMSLIWAAENIAVNASDAFFDAIPTFARLLHDNDDKVRTEAPEFFRVVGKRRPELVWPYLDQLRLLSETDGNSVVRIHCAGAIKAVVGEEDRNAHMHQ